MKGLEYYLRCFFSLIVAAGGAAALYLTLTMNRELGASFGSTAQGVFIQSNSAMLVDFFGGAMALASGFALRDKRRGIFMLTGALAVCFGLYSLVGIIGFGALERINKSHAADKVATLNNEAVAAANAEAIRARNEVLGWVKSSATVANGRVERGQFADKAIELASKPIAVQKFDAADQTSSDPQADVITGVVKRFLPSSNRDGVQLWLVLALGLLLKACEMSAFFISAAMWPRRNTELVILGASVPVTAPVAALVAASVAPEPAAPRPNAATVDLAYQRDLNLVKKWLSDGTTSAPVTVGFPASKVHVWFLDWTARVGAKSEMSLTRFGTITADLGVKKVMRSGRNVYPGLTRRMSIATTDLRATA